MPGQTDVFHVVDEGWTAAATLAVHGDFRSSVGAELADRTTLHIAIGRPSEGRATIGKV